MIVSAPTPSVADRATLSPVLQVVLAAFDIESPFLQGQVPYPGDTNVDPTSNLILQIIDSSTGVDEDTVVIKVNGNTAWQNDAQQTGFSVTKNPAVGGWQYEIDPDSMLPEGLLATIEVYAADLAFPPNVLDTSYTFVAGFVDTVGPYLANQSPAPSSTGAVGQNVVFEVLDDKTDIDDSNTTISINGTPARVSGVDQPGFTTTRQVLSLPFPQKGVHYTVDPDDDFMPSITVSVRVQTQDSADVPNTLDETYTYETTPDVQAPQLIRLNPAPEETDVEPTRGIRLSLIDDYSVVDSSIQIWIRDVLAYYQGSFQESFVNSLKEANAENGFDFLIVPDESLRWERNEQITVRVVAQDTVPNTLDQTYNFTGELAPHNPFSAYRFIMQAVREHDEQSPGLLSQICEAFDQVWNDTMFDRATELPDLFDPYRIPARWLPWLKAQVGFTRDLNFDPTEDELRRVIAGGVELWNDKPAEEAIRDAIRLTTGNRFVVRDYFDLRFEVDLARVLEELENFDPGLLLFSENAYREVDEFRTCDMSSVYPCSSTFYVNDPDLPVFTDPKQYSHVLVVDHPITALRGLYEIDHLVVGTKTGVIDALGFPVQTAQTGPAKLLHVPGDYTTEIRLVDPGIGALKYRSKTAAFTVGQRVHGQNSGASGEIYADTPVTGTGLGQFELTHVIGRFEPNEPLIDPLGGAATADGQLEDVTHQGELFRVLNRDLLDFLVRQVRVFSERPGGELTIAAGAWAFPRTVAGAEWRDQVSCWKVNGEAGAVARLWFMAADTSNGYEVKVDFSANTVELWRVVGGVGAQLGSTVTLPTVISPELDLVVRVDALAEGSDTRIRVKVEGDLQIDLADSPASFTKGMLGVSAETAEVRCKLVEVNALPTEIQRIGPTP